MTTLKELIHTACGKPAYLYVDIPYDIDQLNNPKNFFHLTGARVKDGEEIVCESCGKTVYIHKDGDGLSATTSEYYIEPEHETPIAYKAAYVVTVMLILGLVVYLFGTLPKGM